jgi:hypothetical protein
LLTKHFDSVPSSERIEMSRVPLQSYLRPGLCLSLALLLALALLIPLAATPVAADESPSDHQYKPRDHDDNDDDDGDNNNNRHRHNNRNNNHNNNGGGGGGGVFEIAQESKQEGESGDADQSVAVTSTGDNSDQCAGSQGDVQTGNAQDLTDLAQVDAEADDFESEEVGSTIESSPEARTECTQEVNEAASASIPAANISFCWWGSDGWYYCYWPDWGTYYWDPYTSTYAPDTSYYTLASDVAAGALDAARGTLPLVTLGALALIGTAGIAIRRNRGRDD